MTIAADGAVGPVEAVTVSAAPQTMYNLTVAHVATYLVGNGRWVVHNVDECEFFYRAMSETEYKHVDRAGGLVKRPKGANELFITTSKDYVLSLVDRRSGQRKYPIAVEFEVEAGTLDQLIKLGATHNSATHIP